MAVGFSRLSGFTGKRERWKNGDMMMNTCDLLISAMYDEGETSRDS